MKELSKEAKRLSAAHAGCPQCGGRTGPRCARCGIKRAKLDWTVDYCFGCGHLICGTRKHWPKEKFGAKGSHVGLKHTVRDHS